MKKLLLLIPILLISIGLSGCDLFSQDQVDQISEEYCRDNPTSDVCQGDAVGFLEDEIILNIFNTILGQYDDYDNTTFCDDYFSVTNIDLLDSCRISRESLVPDEYSGFTVSDITKKDTLIDQDVYEITVVSADLLTELVFTISLVKVESITYINSWSYIYTLGDPGISGITLAYATTAFQDFIDDYLDESVPPEDICANFFTDDVAKCIEERNESFTRGFGVIIINVISLEDNLFEVEMHFTDNETTSPKTEFQKIIFTYDEEDNIIMKFIREQGGEEWLDAVDAFEIIRKFLEDYGDDLISDNQFNDMYFDNQMDLGFFTDRGLDLDDEITMNLISVEYSTEEPFDFLVVTLNRTYQGETKSTVVRLRVRDLDNEKYLFEILFDENYGLDQEVLKQFILDLIEDYQDPNLSDTTVCAIYFEHEYLEQCIQDRQAELSDGVLISLIGLYQADNFFEVEFEHSDGSDTWIEYIYANFYYNEYDELKIQFNELGFYEFNYDAALEFMNDLFSQYTNPDVTNFDACSRFFEDHSYDECIFRRQQEMIDGIQLDGFNLMHDGLGYTLEYYYSDSDGYEFSKHMQAYFYYNYNGELRVELFENFDLIPYEIVRPFTEQMVLEYNNFNFITSEDFCTKYFGEMEKMGCVEKRNQDIQDNIHLQLFMLYPEFDHYGIEFQYTDNDGYYWFEVVSAYFYYEGNNLKVEFGGEGPEQFPQDVAYEYFQQLLFAFGDKTLENTDFCNLYFPYMGGDNCVWDRAILPLEHISVYLDYMEYDGYMFETKVIFTNNYTSETWTEIFYL